MKIWRKGKACMANARSARRPPATPPATRLGGTSGQNSEERMRAATTLPALSPIAIRAASPSETTSTITQRAPISGRMPTVAP